MAGYKKGYGKNCKMPKPVKANTVGKMKTPKMSDKANKPYSAKKVLGGKVSE